MTRNQREKTIRYYGATIFAVSIAAVGAIMMTVTSSPQMKGAAFLWLPAALQLIAGVWFGPRLGFFAGGLGAYAAGIVAYGGWGLVDIIMNPIAGGIANAMLPAYLFMIFRINPDFGSNPSDIGKAIIRIIILLIAVLVLGTLPLFIEEIGKGAHIVALILLLVAYPLFLSDLNVNKRDVLIAIFICIFISAVSALIGTSGVVLAGQTWKAAILGTGLGWFLGDTVSSFLGLYMLAYFTNRARKIGLCD